MNRTFKKFISIIVTLTLILCIFIPSFSVFAENESYPTVYLCGQGSTLVKEAGNSNSEKIYPISIDKDYILGTIDELNPVFLKALITGNYDDYCDVIYNAVAAKFEPVLTDKSGEVTDGSGSNWSYSLDSLANTTKNNNGNYGLFDYRFVYDWRLDPCDIAVLLDQYINDVMTVTGAKKINIVSRCLGCNMVAAYLVDYGYEKINKCVFYASALEGIELCNEAFSAEIALDPDSIDRFAHDILGDFIDDETLLEFVKTSVSLANKTNGLDLATDFVTTIYNKVKANIVPRLLRTTVASMPSYLSMTSTASWEKIKKTIFSGDFATEYAGTIAKSDNYHYHVQDNFRQLLLEADETVDFMIIGKYGYQFVPIIESSNEISDRWLELSSATFGGTTATGVTEVFSDKYISAAKANGTDKYISSDKQVDLSTCLFPDYTWVIKRLEHKAFPGSVDRMIEAFLAFDGQMTVNDNASYPQYLVYDETNDTITPMTEDNSDVTNWNHDGLFTLIFKFISQAIPLLINLISKSATSSK